MNKLKTFLKNYSIDDLAKGLFALNLWLPNIASPIKAQYLYSILEEILQELPTESKLHSYKDFVEFSKTIITLTPSFPGIEDYVPEEEWGDIKYFYKKRFYRIFYGGDLSNPYEFYYSFEIIHDCFEKYYHELVGRSAFDEFQFSLEIQDYILKNMHQKKRKDTELHPGDFSVPEEDFWKSVVTFINGFEPDKIYPHNLLKLYTQHSGSPTEMLSLEEFSERAFEGKNCRYFFIEKNGRYYPVLPRRYFSIVFDGWGNILKNQYAEILKREEAAGKKPEYGIYASLVKFLKSRFEDDEVFDFAAPVYPDLKAHSAVFAAITSKNKLFMVCVTPPSISQDILGKHLEKLGATLKECKALLQNSPTQLALLARSERVQFESKGGESLMPRFLVVIPYCTTEVIGFSLPKDFDANVIGLDQFTGIMDEIADLNVLSDFFDYVDEETSSAKMSGLNSYLDLYGSYKDSSSVLIPGANQPDLILLDTNWGSNFRFRTLKRFWNDFPENSFFGHPMSWLIPEKTKTNNGFILEARTYRGYAYFQRVGDVAFYINAPVHLMKYQEGHLTDSLMHMLADSFDIYATLLGKLSLCKKKNKVQIIFFPASLVSKDEKMEHIRHLLQDKHLWKMDITKIGINDFGVRVVFHDKIILDALRDVKDRSLQISLLCDVLKQINIIWPEPDLNVVEEELGKEKNKIPRFKTTELRKTVAYPEAIKPLLPENREFKLADKTIARFAHELGIKPGTYSDDNAKTKIDGLIDKIVKEIDGRVSQYNFEKSLPLILEKTDALIAEHERDEALFKISLDQEVDYKIAERSGEKYQKFLGFYRSYRYLIEKFTQHQSKGNKAVSLDELKELVAIADRLLNVRVTSDFLHYGIYPAEIIINDDFIVEIQYSKNIEEMQDKLSTVRAKLRLGEIGIDTDAADIEVPIEDYINSLDLAFKNDFGFGFKDLINVQQILALWPSFYEQTNESTHYSATSEEIAGACAVGIKGLEHSQIPAILDFLELKSDKLLCIEGQVDLSKDLPTWEHNKRLVRYSIRPLIKFANKYYWGPHSVEQSGKVWTNTISSYRLPADIPNASNIRKVLQDAHRSIEGSLAKKTKEIVSRFTSYVEEKIQPHKIDKTIGDNRYGDYDVLAYIEDKNILLNIESKMVDPDYCLKDLQRTHREVFLGRTRSDGSQQKSYVKRVEERAAYLEKEYCKIMNHLGWKTPVCPPKVVSVL